MSSFHPLAVIRTGIFCPAGATAAATAAALRAGICRYEEVDLDDGLPRNFVMALVRDERLPPLTSGACELGEHATRMVRLARRAAREALVGYRGASVPLYLALPEPFPGAPASPHEKMLLTLQEALEGALDLSQSRTFTGGRAAGFAALLAASETVARNPDRPVLVGGVDSGLHYPLLRHLERAGRLKTSATAEGVVPGEASAFLLCGSVERHSSAPAQIMATALGREPGHLGSDLVYRGDGLAGCVSAALRGLPQGSITNVLAGFTGEHYWAREWTTALIRNRLYFTEHCRIDHPATSIGDSGGAVVPVLGALATVALARRHTSGLSLLIASSDGETRGAAVVGPGQERH